MVYINFVYTKLFLCDTQRRETIFILEPTECPATFTYNASVNGCYKVVTDEMEWSVAGLACRAIHKDAHLLVISDAAEQSAVEVLLKPIWGEIFHSLLL